MKNALRLATAAALVGAGLVLPAQTAMAATVTSGTYENDGGQISYSGTWQVNKHSSDSGGYSSAGKITGDVARMSFDSTGVEWRARTGPSLGIARVWIDHVHMANVDLYSSTPQYQRPVYVTKSLSSGPHLFEIERTGTRNPLSGGNDVVVDSFVVTDGDAPQTPASVSAVEERKGVRISWAASPGADVAGYIVYRAEGDGGFERVSGDSLLKGTQFLDIGLLPESRYRFAVQAVDTTGNSSPRSAERAITLAPTAAVKKRYFDCPTTGTRVSNITQLRAAVTAVKPGSVILLQPGIYRGGIHVPTSGTATAPIWICGPRSAVLDYNNTSSSQGVMLNKVSNVVVSGMTIQNFRKGVVLSGASKITVSDVLIRNVGEEAIKLRYGTTDSTIVKNEVYNTGRVIAQYGEGVYIGSSPKDWCAVYACNQDRSDRNQVIANTISGTTADPIEAKPGTSGGVIRNNVIDGQSVVAVDTLLSVKGNDYLVLDNTGVNGKAHLGVYAGYTEVDGYGAGNVFARNRVGVPAGATAIVLGKGANNLVDCNNTATVSGSALTNVTCQK
jgi:hypothetical protein